MCFRKTEDKQPCPAPRLPEIVTSVGVAFTPSQIIELASLGLDVEYRHESLKIFACEPRRFYDLRSVRAEFFEDKAKS